MAPVSSLTEISGRMALESVLHPEFDLPVVIDCGGDVVEVRAQETEAIHTAVRKQIWVVERVKEFSAQRQRLPFQELERALYAGVVKPLSRANERVAADVAEHARTFDYEVEV